MKSVLKWVGVAILSLLFAFGFTRIPNQVRTQQIMQNKIAQKFDAKTYQGWVLAYTALNEAESTMYMQRPTFETEEEELGFQTLGWPDKFLPDLVNEFGILIQKPYAGTYALNRQKKSLTDYFKREIDNLEVALNAYTVTDPDNPHAYDAAVIKSLNMFSEYLGTLNTATHNLTLEAMSDKSLGDYYAEHLGEDLATPMAYSSIAKDYLLANIKKYRATYEVELKEKSMETLGIEKAQTKRVNQLLLIIE